MSFSADAYGRALARIGALKQAQPELGPLLDYYEALLKAQEQTQTSFRPDLGGVDVEGQPILEGEDVKIDWALFGVLLDRIVRITGRHADASGKIAAWPAMAASRARWQDELLKGLLEDRAVLDDLAGRAGVSLDQFTFLTCHAVSPFLAAYAERLKDLVDVPGWLKGRCPLCGGQPLMAELEEEAGKRLLQCHLCRTEWSFTRLECPFCGNRDHETLRFFYDPEDLLHRVDVCDECKAYLKTVDSRKTNDEVILLVEDLTTVHLDVIAAREGFRREGSGVWGV
jgi:FdhE protein